MTNAAIPGRLQQPFDLGHAPLTTAKLTEITPDYLGTRIAKRVEECLVDHLHDEITVERKHGLAAHLEDGAGEGGFVAGV